MKKIKYLQLAALISLVISVVIIGYVQFANVDDTPLRVLLNEWDNYLLAFLFMGAAYTLLELDSTLKTQRDKEKLKELVLWCFKNFFSWLIFKKKRKILEETEDTRRIKEWEKMRWYSPIAWIVIIVAFIFQIIFDVIDSIRDMELKNIFKYDEESYTTYTRMKK